MLKKISFQPLDIKIFHVKRWFFFSYLKIGVSLYILGLNSSMATDNSNPVSWYTMITNALENVGPEIVQQCPGVRWVTEIMQVCLTNFKKILLKVKAKLEILFKEFHGLHGNLLCSLEKQTLMESLSDSPGRHLQILQDHARLYVPCQNITSFLGLIPWVSIIPNSS